MSGVQFGQQIDMNGFKITEGAPATNPTDFVILSQLTTATDGFAQNLGDNILSTFNVAHNLALADKNDFIARVGEVSTGAEYNVEIIGVDANNVTVTFGSIPTANQYRIVILPVR